ncbi:hypothetical protein ACTFIR_000968 [Dictyostelium discoideum]
MNSKPRSHTHEFNGYFSYDKFKEFYFPGHCTVECLNDFIESLEKYKSISTLYKSLKVNEDGSLPPFNFSDVLNYYGGKDFLVDNNGNDSFNENKNIQDLFTINILDLNFPVTTETITNTKSNAYNVWFTDSTSLNYLDGNSSSIDSGISRGNSRYISNSLGGRDCIDSNRSSYHHYYRHYYHYHNYHHYSTTTTTNNLNTNTNTNSNSNLNSNSNQI